MRGARRVGLGLGGAAGLTWLIGFLVVYGAGIANSYPVFWVVKVLGGRGTDGAVLASEISWVMRAAGFVAVVTYAWCAAGSSRSDRKPGCGTALGGLIAGLVVGIALLGAMSYGDQFSAAHVFHLDNPTAVSLFSTAKGAPQLVELMRSVIFVGSLVAGPLLAIGPNHRPTGGRPATWRDTT